MSDEQRVPTTFESPRHIIPDPGDRPGQFFHVPSAMCTQFKSQSVTWNIQGQPRRGLSLSISFNRTGTVTQNPLAYGQSLKCRVWSYFPGIWFRPADQTSLGSGVWSDIEFFTGESPFFAWFPDGNVTETAFAIDLYFDGDPNALWNCVFLAPCTHIPPCYLENPPAPRQDNRIILPHQPV